MLDVFASEGGYQAFHLQGGEWAWLLFSAVTALLALAVGLVLMRGVLAADQGTPKMIEIATAIQEGAMAYLRRQFKTIAVILVPLAVIVFVTSTKVVKPDGTEALSFVQSGAFRTLAFIAGCLMSGLTGFIGMGLAVRGNVRTAAAAVRTLPRTARLMPMKPVRPDMRQPARKARVRKTPDWANDSASSPLASLTTLVEVMNTMNARGTRITAMVLN